MTRGAGGCGGLEAVRGPNVKHEVQNARAREALAALEDRVRSVAAACGALEREGRAADAGPTSAESHMKELRTPIERRGQAAGAGAHGER